MKGLMVMNEATDIAFYSVDSQLRAHLHRRMEILENSIGQREEEEDLRGLLTTFFAPLTTSFCLPVMKGLMVMNEATDIAFYSVDSQLRAHLHRRMEILENSIGQREEEEDLRGLLTTFFAPLTTSFNVLTSMKKPLFSITADDNFLIVFKKFGEHVFVFVLEWARLQ